MHGTERALFDLRRGQPVHLRDGSRGAVALPVEALDDPGLAGLQRLGEGRLQLVITAHRAAALGLDFASTDSLALELPAASDSRTLLALAAGTGRRPPSAVPAARPAFMAERGALALARSGRLLPAVVTVATPARPAGVLGRLIDQSTVLSVPASSALQAASGAGSRPLRISEAEVPLAGAENARFVLYREADGLLEHVAVLIGDPAAWPEPLPVRLHSACLTGDLFGSLRCDCGEQLRSGVASIAAAGGGVLLYLAQEGRGIGLANKLRAYGLQDNGLDTVDADRILGFGEDERRYDAAVTMLGDLGIRRIRLLTNNPDKIRALQQSGIEVVGRDAVHGQLTVHNRRYLTAKAERSGHWLAEVLGANAARL